MKNGIMVPVLLGIMVMLIVYSCAFLIFLPYWPLPGETQAVEEGRIHRNLGGDLNFRVIKIAHELPRYHPLHQSLSQDFATPLETATNLQVIVELYPEGSLGPEGQIIRGLEKGTLEICLIRSDAEVKWALSLAEMKGPTRHIWKIKHHLPENSRVQAVREGEPVPVFDPGISSLVLSRDVLQREVRNGGFAYIDLDIFEWYYQDWSRWADTIFMQEVAAPQYRLMVNTDFFESLEPALRGRLREYAENFAVQADREMRKSEGELLSLLMRDSGIIE